jgi:hypothetical protein
MANNQTEQEYEQAWRQDHLQEQARQAAEQLRYSHDMVAESRRERDEAAAAGDWETARMANSDVATYEQQVRDLTPQQPPQMSQHDINFLQRKQAFREKYGAAGDATIRAAHLRAVLPRNPNATSTTHPMTYGHGTQIGTPAYYQAVQQEMETNGHLMGTPYDANTDLPGWKEIAHANNPGRTPAEKEQNFLAWWRYGKSTGKIG